MGVKNFSAGSFGAYVESCRICTMTHGVIGRLALCRRRKRTRSAWGFCRLPNFV